MNYIKYRQNSNTVSTKFKVKLYDIVIIGIGYWKEELGIVLYINESCNNVKVRVIKCGMELNLNIKNVQFISHSNKSMAKAYLDLCNKLSDNFRSRYKDKNYIRDNWDNDNFMINDITAKTITVGIGFSVYNNRDNYYSTIALEWLCDKKDIISNVIYYADIDFINKLFYNKSKEDKDLAIKLYNYFYG